MKFINNPFETLLEIMKESYPEVDCDIYIGESMTDGKETFGCTKETGHNTVVEIHHSLSIVDSVKVLAHELAHVIAGVDAEHDEEWEEAFYHIHNEFQKKINEQLRS